MLHVDLFALLCSGKAFCSPGSGIASHLCQNPAPNESATLKNVSYTTAVKHCYRTVSQKHPGALFSKEGHLKLDELSQPEQAGGPCGEKCLWGCSFREKVHLRHESWVV